MNTIGQIVYYRSSSLAQIPELEDEPCVAIVTAVWPDGTCNLAAFDHAGNCVPRTRVRTKAPMGTDGMEMTDEYFEDSMPAKRATQYPADDSLSTEMARTRKELADEETAERKLEADQQAADAKKK